MPSLKRLFVQTTAVVTIASVALIGLTVRQLTIQRDDVTKFRSDELRNLSTTLRFNAENSVRNSSAILIGLMDRYRFGGAETSNVDRMRAVARRQAALYPEIQGLFLYDINGRWVMTTLDEVTPQRNNADRGYFQFHKNNSSDAPYVGPPVRSRSTGDWVFTVSRRYEDHKGNFAGVALATIRLQHFLDFFESLAIGDGVVSLVRDDGKVLVRYPFRQEQLEVNLKNSEASIAIRSGSKQGVITFVSLIDGVRRIYGYSASTMFPLHVSVGINEKDAYASWRSSTLSAIAMAIGALLLIFIMTWRAFTSIQARGLVEREIRQANQQLAQLNEMLEVLAAEDALTGLANRRQLDLFSEKAVIQSALVGAPISFILLDVDFFKRYNDKHGHQAGDRCLRQVADIIRSCLQRTTDMPARYGGEELAVVLPHTDKDGAFKVAERVRAKIYEACLPHETSEFGVITVSVGVATSNELCRFDSAIALIGQADKALYVAKSEGRNRVATISD